MACNTEECTGVGPKINPPADPGHGGCDCDYLQDEIDKKQDKLTAGENISISDDGTISATGGGSTYTAGKNIEIADDVISAPDVYSKSETDALLNAIETGEFVVVDELPEEGGAKNIYLVPKTGGGYTEWVYVNDAWEEIGDTDIDLSDYATTKELTDGLAEKVSSVTPYTMITEEEPGNVVDVSTGLFVDQEPSAILRLKPGNNVKMAKTGDKEITISAEAPDLSEYLTCDAIADCSTISDMQDDIDGKQDALTAGDNVTITDGVISATDTTYQDATATQAGLMSSADKTKLDGLKNYTAGSHISIAEDGTISAECCTKEELLEILGYKDMTISKTDSDGNTLTVHVLGYIKTVTMWRLILQDGCDVSDIVPFDIPDLISEKLKNDLIVEFAIEDEDCFVRWEAVEVSE